MIVKNVSSGDTTDVSFTVHENDLAEARKILAPLSATIGASGVNARSGVAKLSVVGIGMRSHSGVAARFFEALGRGSVNIELISTSEIKIAVVIDEKDAEAAVRLTHDAFELKRLLVHAG